MSFASAYKKATLPETKPPAGWHTIEEVMADFGLARNATDRRLAQMISAGTVEKKMFLMRNADGIQRHRPIYRVKKP